MATTEIRVDSLDNLVLHCEELGVTDVVTNFQDCWRGNDGENASSGTSAQGAELGIVEVERLRRRFEELRKLMVGLEARQVMLGGIAKLEEKLSEENIDGKELEILKEHEHGLRNRFNEQEQLQKDVSSKVLSQSEVLAGKIALYESQLREYTQLIADHNASKDDMELGTSSALETASAESESVVNKLTSDVQAAKEHQANLEHSCAKLNNDINELNQQIHELVNETVVEDSVSVPNEECLDSELKNMNERIDKITDITSIVEELTGLAVSELEENSFIVTFPEESFAMKLFFHPNTFSLINAKILRQEDFGDVLGGFMEYMENRRRPLDNAILQRAIESNNCCTFVREMHERCIDRQRLVEELQRLQNRYNLSAVKRTGELVVTLPNSIIATFELSPEYPKPYSPALLTGLTAMNGWSERLMGETVEYIADVQNERQNLHLVSFLIDTIMERFAELQNQQNLS